MAKLYDWEFGLFERAWGRRGVACPDCVNESNHKVWRRFLDRAVRKLLRAETMETEEFRELLEEASGLGKEGREDGGGEKAEKLHGASEDRLYPEGVDGGFGGGLRRVLQAGGGVSA